MSFAVSADAYMRFMGKYSEPLAARFADLAGVRQGQRAALREQCRRLLPVGPFELSATVWAAVGRT